MRLRNGLRYCLWGGSAQHVQVGGEPDLILTGAKNNVAATRRALGAALAPTLDRVIAQLREALR